MKDKRSQRKHVSVQEWLALAKRSAPSSLLQAAEICDQAKELILRGDYYSASDAVLPVATHESFPLSKRARKIAVMALDEITDEHYEKGDYQSAIRCLDQWIALEPEALYPLVRKAEILWLELDKPDEASQIYRTLTESHPHCVEAWLGLAHIALFREQVDSAIVYLKQAWSAIKHPEWVYPPTKEIVTNIMESMYVLTGRLLAKLGDPLGALQFLAAGMDNVSDSEYIHEEIEIIERLLSEKPADSE
ncbi:MAG: hypothetical protein D6697_11605 [Armatimonadetes bacterium]|jgi:tetratricopeptide (TPR) repeat protein|nr:MAG: hypothetical protein D6697_11605 [Armatimonadota bacterium]